MQLNKVVTESKFKTILEDILKCVKTSRARYPFFLSGTEVYECKVEIPHSIIDTRYVVGIKDGIAVVVSDYLPEPLSTEYPQDLINIHYILMLWYKELNSKIREKVSEIIEKESEKLWQKFVASSPIPVLYTERKKLDIAERPELRVIYEVLQNKGIPIEEYPKFIKIIRGKV